jgi:lysophospholipase L1-like esterase
MRGFRPAAAVAGCAVAVLAGCTSAGQAPDVPARQVRPQVSYYLALGDSLSRGVQPGASGVSAATSAGYADQLYPVLRDRHPGVRLVKLGCPGETTVTMMNGGVCAYPAGSQLGAAVAFLRAHRGRVALVTIDIGANDPSSCIYQPSAARLASCAFRSVPDAAANLGKILAGLRGAAAGVRIVAMNYYLPALARWRDGLPGRALARLGELAAAGYNALLARVYRESGVSVADVFTAFHTADFGHLVRVPGFGALPRNVAAICQWTWECAAPPRGPNEHPNMAGYAVITRSFLVAGAR